MVGWGIDAILSGRFYKIWKSEGFIRAWERGRAARFRHMLDNCGSKDVVPLVGTDVYGNRYYEDFLADEMNDAGGVGRTRWVEFSDRYDRFPSGRKIPPEWHGWLHRSYDDAPTPDNTAFHNPPFKKRHLPNPSGEPHAITPLGFVRNNNKKQFQEYVRSRMYNAWEPNDKKTKRYD
jgi:NADH:ubiquinone oxidoreductase subunit